MVKYLVNGKEVEKPEYDSEFDFQNMAFGTCVHRSSILEDGTFIIELIDYRKVWKEIGGPEPVSAK